MISSRGKKRGVVGLENNNCRVVADDDSSLNCASPCNPIDDSDDEGDKITRRKPNRRQLIQKRRFRGVSWSYLVTAFFILGCTMTLSLIVIVGWAPPIHVVIPSPRNSASMQNNHISLRKKSHTKNIMASERNPKIRLEIQQRSKPSKRQKKQGASESISILFPLRVGSNSLHVPIGALKLRPGPDYGGLHIVLSSDENQTVEQRTISPHDEQRFETYRTRVLGIHPDPPIEDQYDNDLPQDETRSCRKTSWRQLMFPTCNTIHEIFTLERTQGDLDDYKVKLIRYVWLCHLTFLCTS